MASQVGQVRWGRGWGVCMLPTFTTQHSIHRTQSLAPTAQYLSSVPHLIHSTQQTYHVLLSVHLRVLCVPPSVWDLFASHASQSGHSAGDLYHSSVVVSFVREDKTEQDILLFGSAEGLRLPPEDWDEVACSL